MSVLMSESFNSPIHSNGWFIQKRVNWLSLWMGHRIIDSLDSIQTADSFRNESIGCRYEWATESLTHSIHSNGWFVQKRVNWLSLWMGHRIIDSLDSFKRLIRSETSQLAVVMNGPLNHWLTRFIQTADSFRNESIGCPYEWATESLTHSIHSNGWFVQKRVNWLSLWMGHWIIDSLDSFKRLIRSETSQLAVLMNGPLNHWLTRFIQNGWFVQKRVNWLSLWMGHWVIDSLDSFKRLIRSETSQLAVLMNGPQNHWLTRFIQTADSFRNESIGCPYESATESLTHSIHSNGWFVQKRVNWLSLWMGHRIIDSLDSFKRLIC